MLNKSEIQISQTSNLILVVFLFLSMTLTACISEPNLQYPEPKQDFATYTNEPVPRYDASPPPEPDLELDLNVDLDQDLLPDQSPNRPILHTQSLDFVGEEQSTYNGIEPRIIGRYLWVLPNLDETSPKTNDQNTNHAE